MKTPLDFVCPTCFSKSNYSCVWGMAPKLAFHPERIALANAANEVAQNNKEREAENGRKPKS